MEFFRILALVVMFVSAVSGTVLILLQHGKGADMGAAFGSGASGSLFGATGSANFLSHSTAILAALFFISCLGLGYISSHQPKSSGGVMDKVPAKTAEPLKPNVPEGNKTPPVPANTEIPK